MRLTTRGLELVDEVYRHAPGHCARDPGLRRAAERQQLIALLRVTLLHLGDRADIDGSDDP
ncbi:MAG TPA: hypothetical protein VFZ70_16525 [Euzebyales bacterium]